MRIGIGYDIHRLVPGRPLILGGVPIPHDAGLEGHSDADVLLHAIMDALLGAAGLPDIGYHFPPNDERFRDVSSLTLLEHVRHHIAEAGYAIQNVDAVLVAETPRIGPYRAEMQQRIASVLGIAKDAVGIKATTNEGVGAEGRREAMSAHAVALLGHRT